MTSTATSKNGIAIRLTDERWLHIVEEHSELIELRTDVMTTIEDPILIVSGGAGELLAMRDLELGKFLVVVYRELVGDGFVITAFLTRRLRSLERRKQLWP